MFDIQLLLIFLVLGLFVGLFAGLLGIGGGGIMVPVLTFIFVTQGIAMEQVVHLALGTSMASIVVTSFSSMSTHNSKKAVLWDIVKFISIGVMLGAFMATFLIKYLSTFFLTIFFAVFMAIASAQMFLDKKPSPHRTLVNSFYLFLSGGVIGVISAIVSIGGGSLTVPFLLWQNIDIKKAIGTSAAIGFPLAIAGTFGFLVNGWHNTNVDTFTFGFVNLPAVLLISLSSFWTAKLGARLTHKLPVKILKKVFALLLISLSLKMLTLVI